MCRLSDYEALDLCPDHQWVVETELDLWHRLYLPIPQGCVVLDVGSGCGETAFFYLQHGAGFVYGFDASQACVERARSNIAFGAFWTAQVGHINVDIEGAEGGMILETHQGIRPHYLTTIRPGQHLWRIE